MDTSYNEIEIETKREGDIVDLTQKLQHIIKQSLIKDGLACIFIPGSTGALLTMEYEPGLLHDLPDALERLIPKNLSYQHHETWHDDNGHSHVRASILGPSLTIPIREGKLIHGTWQQIVFLEFDTRPRKRTIIVQIVGD